MAASRDPLGDLIAMLERTIPSVDTRERVVDYQRSLTEWIFWSDHLLYAETDEQRKAAEKEAAEWAERWGWGRELTWA